MNIKIEEMPDRETLEAYLEGECSPPKVVFDREQGKFVWVVPRAA